MLGASKDRQVLLTWDLRLQQLLEYRDAHGHVNVPRNWSENPKLARWVTNQRRLLLRGSLREDRRARLESLGIHWSSKADRARLRDDAWDRMFAALRTFHRTYGHLKVPQGWSVEARLPGWINSQRHLRKSGMLAEERVRRLNELGFEWTRPASRPAEPDSATSRQEAWDRLFGQLELYKQEHGSCAVPARWAGNRALSHWVANQRAQRRRGVLAPDRVDRLTRLGFHWSGGTDLLRRREEKWEKMFGAFKASRSRRPGKAGEAPVSASDLAAWVCRQRRERELGKLRVDRLRRLNQAGFPWDSGSRKNQKPIRVHSRGQLLSRN